MADEQSEPKTAQNEPQGPQAAQPQPQPESQPQAPPQEPQPQIVIPPAQPPAPPANAQEVIAQQQAALAQQQAWAQARDRNQFGPVAEGIQGQAPAPMMGGALQQAAAAQQQQQPPVAQGVNLPPGVSAQQVAQGLVQQQQPIPQQPQVQIPQPQIQPQPQPQIALNTMIGGLRGLPDPAVPQGGHEDVAAALIAAGLPDPSIPQDGVTVAQLKQQNTYIQGAQQGQQQHQQQQQQQPTSKPTVRWYPGRNSKTIIEFQDSVLTGLPDGVEQEPDPQAKVVAVLLMEILALRERVDNLEQMAMQGGGGGALEARVQVLERTLFEQTKALQQSAQAFREEQVRLAAEQNVAGTEPTE